MGVQRHGLRPFRPTKRVCVRQRHGDPLHRPEHWCSHQSFCSLVLPPHRGQRFKHGLRRWLFTDADGRLFPDRLHSRRRQGRHQQRQQHGLRFALPNSQCFGGQHHGACLHDGSRLQGQHLRQHHRHHLLLMGTHVHQRHPDHDGRCGRRQLR